MTNGNYSLDELQSDDFIVTKDMTLDQKMEVVVQFMFIQNKRWQAVEPLVKRAHDQKVMAQWKRDTIKGVVIILGAFAAVTSIAYTVLNIIHSLWPSKP